jgi:hypothetical protein
MIGLWATQIGGIIPMNAVEKVASLEQQLSVECEMVRLLTAELDDIKRRHQEQIVAVNKFASLVDYGCTVQRGSKPGDDLYVVVDVDGIVIASGPTALAAAYRGVFKIETGEDPSIVCEHGALIGDWCEPCNTAYKQAIVDNDDECVNCHQIGNRCTCEE